MANVKSKDPTLLSLWVAENKMLDTVADLEFPNFDRLRRGGEMKVINFLAETI